MAIIQCQTADSSPTIAIGRLCVEYKWIFPGARSAGTQSIPDAMNKQINTFQIIKTYKILYIINIFYNIRIINYNFINDKMNNYNFMFCHSASRLN